MKCRYSFYLLFSFLLSVLSQSTISANTIDQTSTLNNSRVNPAMFNGYKLFRVWCARCHGTFGQGLAAPDLTQSLNQMSREAFMTVVTNGRNEGNGDMPAWRDNPSVMNGREDIYRYLKARANGSLGPIQPTLSR